MTPFNWVSGLISWRFISVLLSFLLLPSAPNKKANPLTTMGWLTPRRFGWQVLLAMIAVFCLSVLLLRRLLWLIQHQPILLRPH